MSVQADVAELQTLLPVLEQRSKAGLIIPNSFQKATDLIEWYGRRGSLTEAQCRFVATLIGRAKKKVRGNGVTNVAVTQTVDIEAVAGEVLKLLGERGNVDTDAVAASVLAKVDGKLMQRVTDDVLKQLDHKRQVEIVVKNADTGKKKVVKGAAHREFEKLMRACQSKLPNGYAPGIFLQGEASSGKTTGCKMAAEALGLDWYFNGAISMPHEMLGFIDGHGKYHTTPFRQAYEKGGLYTFDEVDRSDPVALLAVNPHLANDVATFPDKQVKRHPNCIIVCTANTWGLGADANYSGATKLDAAFLSRFPVRINWDIDPALEEAIVAHPEWLATVRKARDKARVVGLKVMIDTRIAQAGAALIQSGYSLQEAAEMTYLANLKPAQRQQLESAA